MWNVLKGVREAMGELAQRCGAKAKGSSVTIGVDAKGRASISVCLPGRRAVKGSSMHDVLDKVTRGLLGQGGKRSHPGADR